MRVKFLDQAKMDLIQHNHYYREIGGVALAKKMLAHIKSRIKALEDHPEIAQLYELAPNIRRLVVAKGALLVFYRVSTHIEVIHIRRSERIPVSKTELETLNNKNLQ